MKKIIFIDWYETYSFSKIWGHLETENPSLYHQVQHLIFNNSALVNDWMRGNTRFCNICHYLEENGINRLTTQTEFMRGLSLIQPASPLFLPILMSLKSKGYQLYIATDNFDIFGAYMYPYAHLEQVFNGYISSAEEGVLKEDLGADGKPVFFKNFLIKNKLTYKDCILIDNDPSITALYKSCGMATFTPQTPSETVSALHLILKNQL